MSSRGVRTLHLIIGILATVLAGLGVFLPILPTTPFLLIAAWAFAASSPKLHAWITENPWFGPYLERYRMHKAISRRDRAFSLALLWVGILASAIWATDLWWLRGFLVATAMTVTIHLAMLKTWNT